MVVLVGTNGRVSVAHGRGSGGGQACWRERPHVSGDARAHVVRETSSRSCMLTFARVKEVLNCIFH